MTIKVYVVDFGRKYFMLRWWDHDGVPHAESSKCTKRRDADRKAAEKEKELNAAEWSDDGSIPWESFVLKYDEEHLSGLSKNSKTEARGALQSVASLIKPQCLRDVTSQSLSRYVALRRKEGRAEDTIKKNLRHIAAALRWGVGAKYLPYCPTIPKIPRSRKGDEAKGRALTASEFDAMMGAVAAQVGNAAEASWKHLLEGLWLSGLRISEAMQLRWRRGPWIWVDVRNPERPVLAVPGGEQKSGRDQRLPLTPDFGAFLAKTPPERRVDYVFEQLGAKGGRCNAQADAVRAISAIGKSAGIVVDDVSGKFASAHDLRRSFGARWSVRVMPVVLRELMRHASIETTMKYYVGQSIDRIHDALHDAIGLPESHTLSNISPSEPT